ncbi:GAF domain-containing protein [Alteromonas halophila]|uniref:Phytochrome chromophore attachment site domain-containing protein n=1 Tax=Alteromonas halophila TaxID=516698 RepID=A0A918MX96_9ALTE|nr:GAF domain-containing protein [Alteromonas halophila]GGW80203.1 hypothetical protein GCM10007391_11320 [Alteromonas halophila]
MTSEIQNQEALTANCEKEQLHLSGQIQNIGYMIVADADTLDIVAASDNISGLTGADPQQMLSLSLSAMDWLPESLLIELNSSPGSRAYAFNHYIHKERMHLRSFRAESRIIIEVEPARSEHSFSYAGNNGKFPGSSRDTDWDETDYWNHLLDELMAILPFHRFVLYRFSDDFSGEVVAERAEGGDTQYLGLKFPASDIPAIARQMYYENPSRLIADVNASATDLIGKDEETVNLTWSELRSVSPVHNQYLKNMGVCTSYSIPLMISNRLWGIVSCHHPTALPLDAQFRYEAEQSVRRFCSTYATYLSRRKLAMLRDYDDVLSSLLAQMTLTDDADEANQFFVDALKARYEASHVALRVKDGWYHSDQEDAFSQDLDKIDRKYRQDISDYILHTQSVRDIDGLGDITASQLRGLMTIRVSFERNAPRLYLFRPPEAQITNWAGNPDKNKQAQSGSNVLSPRTSFEKWTQVKGESSMPWSTGDILFAKKVRVSMLNLINQSHGNWS